jgi:hypothetical protein
MIVELFKSGSFTIIVYILYNQYWYIYNSGPTSIKKGVSTTVETIMEQLYKLIFYHTGPSTIVELLKKWILYHA